MRSFDRPDGAVPGGGEAAPPQDDLHELLRAERDPRDPLPEVPQHGAPPEGEGSPEGVALGSDPLLPDFIEELFRGPDLRPSNLAKDKQGVVAGD